MIQKRFHISDLFKKSMPERMFNILREEFDVWITLESNSEESLRSAYLKIQFGLLRDLAESITKKVTGADLGKESITKMVDMVKNLREKENGLQNNDR